VAELDLFPGGARADATSPTDDDDDKTSPTQASIRSSSGSSQNSQASRVTRKSSLEWDHYDDGTEKLIPSQSELLGPTRPPDNRFSSISRPYKGPKDAIQRWVNEGQQAIGTPQPVVTRAGRQIKTRRMFSPESEAQREKELRAQARAEAQIKEAERARIANQKSQHTPIQREVETPHRASSTNIALKKALFEEREYAPLRRSPRLQAKTISKEARAQAQAQAQAQPANPTDADAKAHERALLGTIERSQIKPMVEEAASPTLKTKASSKSKTSKSKSTFKSDKA